MLIKHVLLVLLHLKSIKYNSKSCRTRLSILFWIQVHVLILGKQELDKIDMLSSHERIVQLKLNHVCKILTSVLDIWNWFYQIPFSCIGIIIVPGVAHIILLFLLRRVRLDLLFRFTFYSTAFHCWNSLPNKIESISDLRLFQLVKEHLVYHYIYWLLKWP